MTKPAIDAVSTQDAFAALRTEEGRRNPYPLYAALHGRGPAFVPADPDSRYAVVATGYETVDHVLRDPAFMVTDGPSMDTSSPAWKEHPTLTTLMGSMMFSNPPVHQRMRRVVGQVFTARRVTLLEPAIHALVDDLLDHLDDVGSGGTPLDFMAEFAFPLPSDVIGALLGVPPEDRVWFRPLVEAIGLVLDLGGVSAEAMAAADSAALQLTDYFARLAALRRAEPQDDLVSSLVRQQADDPGVLTDPEVLGNLVVLFNAGFVTTTHLLGNGLRLLLDRPAELAAVRSEPALGPGFVEEVLRYESPVQLLTRWASTDASVATFAVPAGGRVVLLLGAANRDPARFPEPDVFDPRRADNQPLSFGAGVHYCIGAALSRIEAQIAFPKLLARFPALAPHGTAKLSNQLTLRGFSDLPVTVA